MSRNTLPRNTSRKSTGRIIFVLGGAASGKSQTALRLAGSRGSRAFVATGQGLDKEMAVRIARHRATRSPDWVTAEVPIDAESWFSVYGPGYQTIVFDCVTLWLSNLIGAGLKESTIHARVEALLHAMRVTVARVVIVSNELGLGLVPADKSTRSFRDLAGRVNQQIAAEADAVHMVLSGMVFRLK
jgi:adenosylcobinamide kinase / adenosylcobinamide-phosphate guanylyltransferase